MPEEALNELVKRLKASDHEAFRAVFNQWQQTIFNFLHFRTKNVARAEDLLQEVFLKLWDTRTRLDEKKSLRNYLYTIANNLALNEARHEKVVVKHKEGTVLPLFSNTENPEFIFEEKEWKSKLEGAIASLPEKPRVIFLMSRMEDLSYQEIADRLSISIKTVETHMVTALRHLRQTLSKKL
jgi:RNA polymerase sigma-70 factor (ECF subfamily)